MGLSSFSSLLQFVTLEVPLKIQTSSKFGVMYSFIVEELFNTIINSDKLIDYCRENNYNFPETLDLYIEDLENFMAKDILRVISIKDNFSIVRDSELNTCIVPNSFIINK